MPTVKQKLLERFGVEIVPTSALIKRVEDSDDLWKTPKGAFVRDVITRALPNVFHPFLNTWPQVKVNQVKFSMDSMVYTINVHYDNWHDKGEFDGSDFETDRQAFCDRLEAFACAMSEKFITEQDSGNPWWTDHDDKHSTCSAYCKHGDKMYSLNTKLAYIKFRGGKWCWFLVPSHNRSDWSVKEHKQGKSDTLEGAKAVVADAWKVNHG